MDAEILDHDLPDGQRPLRVVIAYDRVDDGKRAMRVLSKLSQQSGADLKFQPFPWAFDLLSDADWREAAAHDAVSADILIVATSSTHLLSPGVERWLAEVINRKHGTAATVVALFGPEENSDGAGSARLRAIQAAAREAGLDFFAPAPLHELNEAIARIHERAEMVTPVLEGILHHHLPPAPCPNHNN